MALEKAKHCQLMAETKTRLYRLTSEELVETAKSIAVDMDGMTRAEVLMALDEVIDGSKKEADKGAKLFKTLDKLIADRG